MKRILIPYISAGLGHVSFAKALRQYLLAKRPGWEVRLYDPGAELPGGQQLDQLYVESWKKILALPGPVKAAAFALEPFFAPVNHRINARYIAGAAPSAARFLAEWQPDAILPTHWGCAHLFAAARVHPDAPAKRPAIWYVYTELGGAYRLINCGADAYFSLTPEANAALRSVGVPARHISPIDLVVQPDLHQAVLRGETAADQVDARRSLGLDPATFTVVFSLGGEGIGRAMDYLQAIYESDLRVQVIALTGKNQDLFDDIAARLPPRAGCPLIKPFGFLPDLILPFRAADALAGKCGTSFAMETVKMKRPLLVCQLGAPNEKENMKYLVRHGFGWNVPGPERFLAKLRAICDGGPEWQAARQALARVGSDNGAETMAQALIAHLESTEKHA